MDTRRLGFAEPPDHSWCKMRRRRPVAFHISDKTFFRPKLPACPRIKPPDSRMLLNPKPAGQSANAAIGRPFNSNVQYPGSHDDAFFVVGSCVEDQRITIRPLKNPTRNENTRKHQQKLHSPSAVA
jgi:hypothetical protein